MKKINSLFLEINGSNMEHIKEKASRWRKIKLLGKDPKSLSELIFRLVSNHEATVYSNSRKPNNNGVKQCSAHRARSVEDVFKAAKYYKPDITLEQVHKAMNKLREKHKIAYHFCGTVRKYVHNGTRLSDDCNQYSETLGKLNINF